MEAAMKAAELNELSNSLKPCPFCGDKARLEPFNTVHWRVRCRNFHCGGTNYVQMEAEEAVEKWNKRQ